eukprot:114416-Alexandrium_andersonii.AAC.1
MPPRRTRRRVEDAMPADQAEEELAESPREHRTSAARLDRDGTAARSHEADQGSEDGPTCSECGVVLQGL